MFQAATVMYVLVYMRECVFCSSNDKAGGGVSLKVCLELDMNQLAVNTVLKHDLIEELEKGNGGAVLKLAFFTW